MSHLLAPQEEKKDSAAASKSSPAVTDTSFLVPPQEEKAARTRKSTGRLAHLLPPQEEMIDVAALRGEQARLDRAIARMQEKMNKRRIEQDADDSFGPGGDKQRRDSVLSGAAGVTGEDIGFAENEHLV
ncbi:hypothetical protein L226DRAFT_530223 [Lentinus tigrinus ALCF2SS1-7]|uniref:Uncharacterized protein n=1 Tax=Lentinus tigrinus ALCF2SS1-6 TaxID=1328759 RepID=A0A5C2SQL1_9APHY|nr:hypothetical protein L227DRAFT_606232 [Lentinus tigrinus ALCF2SS1-6]RPD80025.1 hypothetical protein L226DRAFT_530223 [Lentinus tigrinus ALCF2SS1-7]